MLGDFCRWCLVHATSGIPSTNNALESFHKEAKKSINRMTRMPTIPELIAKLADFIENYTRRAPGDIYFHFFKNYNIADHKRRAEHVFIL